MAKQQSKVTIYTDGGADPNPGPGGWGAILIHDPTRRQKELSGGDSQTTNNRMELMAAIRALEALKERCTVVFYSDSSYLVQGMTRWARGWAKNGWKRGKKKQPLENDDLWKRLWQLKDEHDIEWHWVKGHAGNDLNERADQLATAEIRAYYDELAVPPSTASEVFLVVSARDGQGFWAASIRHQGMEDMITGTLVQNATSNRLDVIAAAEALRLLPDKTKVSVYSMSDYLRNGASMWIKGWKNRGWQTKDGGPVKNRDEWMELDSQMRRLEVSWPDVKDDDTLQIAFEDVGLRAQELFEMERSGGEVFDDAEESAANAETVDGIPVLNVDAGLESEEEWDEEEWDGDELY